MICIIPRFANCFTSWIQSITNVTKGDLIAIDGKTLRRSYNKSNEITAIPTLLNSLAIKGCIIAIDAMGCQKDIAEQIVKQKGDYLLALKGNQGHFHEEVDTGHGRIETHRAYAVDFKTFDQRFYISSSQPSAEILFKC